MAVKLIALDLDGTLLNSQKVITQATDRALKEAAARGIAVVPVTGRPYSGLPAQMKQWKYLRYVLSLNGTYIVDIINGKVIYASGFCITEALELWNLLKQFHALPDCAVDGRIYMEYSASKRLKDFTSDEQRIELFGQTREGAENIETLIRGCKDSVNKMNLFFNNTEDRQSAMDALKAIPYVEVTSSLPQNLELNKKGFNKGDGLVRLASHLGLKMSETVVFGDSDNDLSMFLVAGEAIAMGNAVDTIKKVATSITLGNDEDGIAYGLRHILKVI